jgi:hypothetical protein
MTTRDYDSDANFFAYYFPSTVYPLITLERHATNIGTLPYLPLSYLTPKLRYHMHGTSL